jgi:hypothetical protein
MSTYMGIDNGVSGSIGILRDGVPELIAAREYTRVKPKRKNALECDPFRLIQILDEAKPYGVVLERPFRGQFRNTEVSAAHFDSVVRTILETKGIPFIQVDSKKWQGPLLGVVKAGETKSTSMSLGKRRWPTLAAEIEDQGDADALFMAVHAMHEFGGK